MCACDDDKTSKKPIMWCMQCRLPLCDHHVVPHSVNYSSPGNVHFVVPLSMASQENLGEGKDSATPMCPPHGEALKYHCGTCDVAICGSCTAIGDHIKHDHVRPIKDVLNETTARVNAKVDTLENDVTNKLERSLQAVEKVSTKLSTQADEVRNAIKQAGERAKEFVATQVKNMVQEVDRLELHRWKLLDSQRDELKSHLYKANTAIRFRDRVINVTDSGEKAQFARLNALETQTASLISTPIKDQPCHHARLLFSAASNVELTAKTKESVGKVIPCLASAEHSEIEGSTTRSAQPGKTVDITVHTKGDNGDNLTTGGDIVTTQCTSDMATAAANCPTTAITDNNDGTYTISCACSSVGTYKIEVFVNGEKMATDVNITLSSSFISSFDPTECPQSIRVSDDRKTASIVERDSQRRFHSVLGISPMRYGQHSWKVRIGDTPPCHCLGVSPKPLSSKRLNDHNTVAYCWKSLRGGQHIRDGVMADGKLSDWHCNDTLQLDLDCDRHTLQITNLRSGESSTFSNLPDKEYYCFVGMLNLDNSAEFVQ